MLASVLGRISSVDETTPCGRPVRPQRGLSQETDLEDHTPHGKDLLGEFMLPSAGKSIISQGTRGSVCFRKPRNAGFGA